MEASYVRNNSNAANNYGSQGYLVVKNKSDDVQEVYLKFDMHGLPENITSAKVRLYALENGITTNWNILKAENTYSTSTDPWLETGINWNNKPTTGDLITSANSQASAGYIYFDITTVMGSIPSDSMLTLKITANTDVYSSFRSRNFGTDNLRLKIIYEYTTKTTSLPVELLYFKAENSNSSIHLSWETASERNNDYFEIQRSENAIDFEVIGKVYGNSTTVSVSKYSYVDSETVSRNKGLFYYRLRQVDFDGKSILSSIIALSLPNTNRAFLIGPNPTSGKLTVFANETYSEPVDLSIINKDGYIIAERQLTQARQVDFLLDHYPAGIYLLRIKGNNLKPQIFKFLLNK